MPNLRQTHDARAAVIAEIIADAKTKYRLDPTIQAKFPSVYAYLRSIFRALNLGENHE